MGNYLPTNRRNDVSVRQEGKSCGTVGRWHFGGSRVMSHDLSVEASFAFRSDTGNDRNAIILYDILYSN